MPTEKLVKPFEGKETCLWMISFVEDEYTELREVVGFNYEEAVKVLKKKYGKFGTWDEMTGEVIMPSFPGEVRYYTVHGVPLSNEIVMYVSIEDNTFGLYSRIPGLSAKMVYIDKEYSDIHKIDVVEQLNRKTFSSAIEYIKQWREPA